MAAIDYPVVLMKRLAVLLLCLVAPSVAQDDPVRLRERATSLVNQGKYAEAEPLLKSALAAC